MREFVEEIGVERRRWPWQPRPQGKGLYLDGSYGVGKTHLLAAAYHAAGRHKAYLTFQELVHLIGALGLEATRERFADVSLVCIDEFELDDPGNTLIVKRFLEQVFERGGATITTSNTPAEAQGQGRFNADDFRREIQGIASRFTAVRIVGSDFRNKQAQAHLLNAADFAEVLESYGANEGVVRADFEELLGVLRGMHPISYRALLDRFDLLLLSGVETIEGLNDALRFVHFIDQLYDRRVGLRAAGEIALSELFHPSYWSSGYQRKFERCISRLGELLDEPVDAAATGLDQAEGFD